MGYIMSSSIVIIVTCVTILTMWYIIASNPNCLICIPKSITLMVESYSVCHLVPRLVKVVCLVISDISVQIFLSLLVAHPLFHHFPSLTVQHALMCHLLKPCAGVFVHLVSLSNLLAVRSYRTSSVCLEGLFDGSAVFADGG